MGNNLPVLADSRRAVSDTDLFLRKKAGRKAAAAVKRSNSGVSRKPSVRRSVSVKRHPSLKTNVPVRRNASIKRNASIRRNASVSRKPSLRRSTSVRRYNRRYRLRSIKRKNHVAIEQKTSSIQRTKRVEVLRVAREQKQMIAAAARGNVEEVEVMIDTGVDVNSADENLMTALHHAAKHAREGVIKSLIDRGADVNATDLQGGFTPLHWVVINANPQMGSTDHVDESIIALARGGCNVNSTDFNFATPLHLAAQTDNHVCINSLIRLGADPDLKDIMGRNAKQVARSEATRKLIHKLQKIKQRALYHVLEVSLSPTYDTPGHFYHVLEVTPHSPPAEPIYTIPDVRPTLPPRYTNKEHYYHTPEITASRDEHIYHALEQSPPSPPPNTPPPPPPRRRKHYLSPSPPPVTRPPTPPRRRKCHSNIV